MEERGQGRRGPGGNTGDLREAGGPGRGLEGLEGTLGCMCEGGMRARERAGGPGGAGAWEWGLKEAAGLRGGWRASGSAAPAPLHFLLDPANLQWPAPISPSPFLAPSPL